MIGPTVTALQAAVDALDIAVDGDELALVLSLREQILAKAMGPLRVFDELELYQGSKATSTKNFVETNCGLTANDAGATVTLARKLKALPETEKAWLDGELSPGQIKAVAAIVPHRLTHHYAERELDHVATLAALDVADTAKVLHHWVNCADAVLTQHPDERYERTDALFHAKTLGDRYDTRGDFNPTAGATIDLALQTIMADTAGDTPQSRPPAERRAEALVDVCNFYLNYRARSGNDPEQLPARRNWTQLVAITTTDEIRDGVGGTLLNGETLDQRSIDTVACNTELLRMVLDPDGAIRSYDLLPATAIRDRGCRWPGCHKPAYLTDFHHVRHRQHGGDNCPENGCLFCKYHHHRGAHDPTIALYLARDGTLTITHADGPTETTKPPGQQPTLAV